MPVGLAVGDTTDAALRVLAKVGKGSQMVGDALAINSQLRLKASCW